MGQEIMFMGEYQHTIDAKGRMIVPAKFREGLGEQFVLTRGLDQCLFGYPMHEWKQIEEKLKDSIEMMRYLPCLACPVRIQSPLKRRNG